MTEPKREEEQRVARSHPRRDAKSRTGLREVRHTVTCSVPHAQLSRAFGRTQIATDAHCVPILQSVLASDCSNV